MREIREIEGCLFLDGLIVSLTTVSSVVRNFLSSLHDENVYVLDSRLDRTYTVYKSRSRTLYNLLFVETAW